MSARGCDTPTRGDVPTNFLHAPPPPSHPIRGAAPPGDAVPWGHTPTPQSRAEAAEEAPSIGRAGGQWNNGTGCDSRTARGGRFKDTTAPEVWVWKNVRGKKRNKYQIKGPLRAARRGSAWEREGAWSWGGEGRREQLAEGNDSSDAVGAQEGRAQREVSVGHSGTVPVSLHRVGLQGEAVPNQ